MTLVCCEMIAMIPIIETNNWVMTITVAHTQDRDRVAKSWQYIILPKENYCRAN